MNSYSITESIANRRASGSERQLLEARSHDGAGVAWTYV